MTITIGFGLDFGMDYTDYTMNDNNHLESELTDNSRQLLDYTSDQKIRKFSVYADQSHGLANDWILKYGVRYDYTDNKNSQLFNQARSLRTASPFPCQQPVSITPSETITNGRSIRRPV